MTAAELPVTRIRPSRGWIALDLRTLWQYRELIGFLALREIQVRYKQTLLGVAWIALHPLALIFVFSFIFGQLAGMPSDGIPYPVFAMAGLVPWNFFASAFSRGSTSLVGSANLISKVYFPRLAIPLASVLSPVVDFAVAMVVLLGLSMYYGVTPTLAAFGVVPFLALALTTALGIALWLSALNVRYRDVGQMLPIATQIWFYATPVIYPPSLLPERWRALYALNPMATVVEGFRWALVGGQAPRPFALVMSASIAAVLVVTGAFAFRRMERTFADLV